MTETTVTVEGAIGSMVRVLRGPGDTISGVPAHAYELPVWFVRGSRAPRRGDRLDTFCDVSTVYVMAPPTDA